jgi:hypothetical protein
VVVCLAALPAACGSTGNATPTRPARLAVTGVLTNADLATGTMTITALVRNPTSRPLTLRAPAWDGGVRTRVKRAGFVAASQAQTTIALPGTVQLSGSSTISPGKSAAVVYLLHAKCTRSPDLVTTGDAASVSVGGQAKPVLLVLGSQGRGQVSAAYETQCSHPTNSRS